MLCLALAMAPSALAGTTISLDEAISRALQFVPTLDAARAQSDLGGAKEMEARAPLYPDIWANAEYNQAPGYDQIITNRGLTLSQLALNYVAFDGGRVRAQARAARYAAEAAALGLDAARAQIVFDTTVAFSDLLRARATERELTASVGKLERYVSIVDALRRSGRAIANDALKLRTTRDSAELALAAARQAAAHASILLASMIGEDGRDDLVAGGDNSLPTPANGDLVQSPALRASARQVESAKLAVTAARAERSPTVKLALTTGWEGIDPPKTFGRHLGASYDGALAVPIFQGGLVRSHIDEALAAQHSAEAQRRQIELELRRDLADAKSRYQSARDQLALLASSQETADDASALMWTRFLGGGNATMLDVTDAYQQAETLRLARFDNEFAMRQATAQIALIFGIAR